MRRMNRHVVRGLWSLARTKPKLAFQLLLLGKRLDRIEQDRREQGEEPWTRADREEALDAGLARLGLRKGELQ